MALEAKRSRKRLDKVRFTSEMFRHVGRFTSSLGLKIIRAAAQRAATRVAGDRCEFVIEEDILYSARLFLPGALAELTDALGQNETSYARRKVS